MKKIYIMFIIMFSFMTYNIWAEEPISDFDKVSNDEWPTQVIFDTVNVCYNGTLRWVAMGNPNLLNQPPPYHVARIMSVHCFCVLDKVRSDFKYRAYVDYIMKDKGKPVLIPKLFMRKSLECIRDFGTLQGLVILDEEALKGLDEFGKDNETQIDKEEGDSPNDSGKSDSPEQPEELPIGDQPLLNF